MGGVCVRAGLRGGVDGLGHRGQGTCGHVRIHGHLTCEHVLRMYLGTAPSESYRSGSAGEGFVVDAALMGRASSWKRTTRSILPPSPSSSGAGAQGARLSRRYHDACLSSALRQARELDGRNGCKHSASIAQASIVGSCAPIAQCNLLLLQLDVSRAVDGFSPFCRVARASRSNRRPQERGPKRDRHKGEASGPGAWFAPALAFVRLGV